MAVIESNNRILRAGDSPVGTRYFDGDYIHIDENNHINFTGDFSGLSSKVDECCADAQGQLSSIKGSVSSLSSQFVDCCSSVNDNLTEIWNAVNANSANITNNSNNISILSGNTALLDVLKLDRSAYTEPEQVPWITAWKNVSANITADFGNSYCVLSSIDVSGNKNHAVGVKGAWISLPTTAHISSALGEKLDISSYVNFLSSEYYTAKSDIYNQINNKFDSSAISAYIPYSAVSGSDNIITGINGSALSAGLTYTAGPNIKITDNEISGKDWSDDITGASSYAYNQAVTNITAVSYAASSDSATYDSDGNKITETYISAIPDDVITTADTFVSSVNNLTPELVSGGINGHELSLSGSFTPTGIQLSGEDPIQIEKRDGKVVVSITGSIGDTYDVKASSNIYVATAGNTFTVSGKDWHNTITAASAYAASHAQGKTYTGVAPIVVNNDENKISANEALLSAQLPLYIEESYYNGWDVNTIKISGVPVASAYITTSQGSQDIYDVTGISYRQSMAGSPEGIVFDYDNNGTTGSISGKLIPSSLGTGFVYNYGINGGISTAKADISTPAICKSSGCGWDDDGYNSGFVKLKTSAESSAGQPCVITVPGMSTMELDYNAIIGCDRTSAGIDYDFGVTLAGSTSLLDYQKMVFPGATLDSEGYGSTAVNFNAHLRWTNYNTQPVDLNIGFKTTLYGNLPANGEWWVGSDRMLIRFFNA